MAWTIEQIERTFIEYMVRHGHTEIEGHSVRSPTDDVLFTTAGMHPLVPYLNGEDTHPAGRRLTDVQRCVRTRDGELTTLRQRNVDTGMGLEQLALFLNDHTSVWQTDELHELLIVVGDTLGVGPDQLDPDAARSLRIVTDHLRASLAIAAAGIQPSASRQGYILRKLIRRAVRHGELLKGTDQGLAQSLVEATDRVSNVMGRRWPDVGPGPGGDVARATIDKEASKFAKTLRKGVDHLQHLADASATFDGELAFLLADTMGYPRGAVGRGGGADRHGNGSVVAAALRRAA